VRKRLLILARVVLALAVLAAVPLSLPTLPKTPLPIDYDRVRRGMTAEEVHDIMGWPDSTAYRWPATGLRTERYDYPRRPPFEGPILIVPPEAKESVYVFYAQGRVTKNRFVRREGREPAVREPTAGVHPGTARLVNAACVVERHERSRPAQSRLPFQS
jgi:hypothetical protein